MHKAAVTFALLAAVLFTSPAVAATVAGPIKMLSSKTCTLVIGKHVFSFGKTCDFSKLKVGERVIITFAAAGRTLHATAITPA